MQLVRPATLRRGYILSSLVVRQYLTRRRLLASGGIPRPHASAPQKGTAPLIALSGAFSPCTGQNRASVTRSPPDFLEIDPFKCESRKNTGIGNAEIVSDFI